MIDRSDTPPSDSNRRYPIRWLALITLIAVAMGPVLFNDFVRWDDDATLSGNPRLNPPSLANVLYYWRHEYMYLYVPMTYTVWSALAAVARGDVLNPFLFHAASLSLHVASVLVLWSLLRNLGCGPAAAGIGAATFGVHPIQVEAVAWASGLKDVLGGLFTLLALLYYVRSAKSDSPAQRRWWYLLAAACYVLGMLSKPTAIVFPLLAATIDAILLRSRARDVLARIAPLLLLAVPCAIWTRMSQPTSSGLNPILPLALRPLIAADAIAFYLQKILFPVSLAMHYGRRPDVVWQNGWALWTWIIPLGAALLVFLLRRRARWLVAAMLLFVFGLFPVLGLVPFEFQYYSTVADHYMYLPMLGVAVAAAFAIDSVTSARMAAIGIALLVLLGWTMMANRQARRWRDTETLMTQTVKVNDQSWVALVALGRLDLARGDVATGLAKIQRAVEVRPDDVELRNDLGTAYDQAGDRGQAMREYREALRMAPALAGPWVNIGGLLAEQGQLDEAIRCFNEALTRDRSNQAAQIGLQRALAGRGTISATAPSTRPGG